MTTHNIHDGTLAEQYLFYREQVTTLRSAGYSDAADIVQHDADRLVERLDYYAHRRQH